MPRKKPFSAKQRKAQLLDKRAHKRSEDVDGISAHASGSTRAKTQSRTELRPSSRPQRSGPGDETSTRLQSKFIALTPAYLDQTRNLAYSTVLTRPIEANTAVFPVEELLRGEEGLKCPGRPKFKFGQTKKEVERNEEGMFKKWLQATEQVVHDYVEGAEDDEGAEVRSPTWFETNLEVWRQLWRVTETSSILLLLLDSRCPPLHCPPSLRAHVKSIKPAKEVILVLTKSDLVDPTALAAWRIWVKEWWGEDQVEVVSVMSYDLDFLRETGKHRPDIPLDSLDQLIDALSRAQKRLLTPPERIRDDVEKLSKWEPRVRKEVDWLSLKRSLGKAHPDDDVQSADEEPSAVSLNLEEGGSGSGIEDEAKRQQREPLTIGLIGQPNVGKSSLLNAILGEQRVRASKTPGKTKHFQTMFWGPKKEVKLVDCPGLVCPSLVGLETQALAGILPISQIPSLPACIHRAADLLPVEVIFRIPAPDADGLDTDYSAKKTWREPKEAQGGDGSKVKWTAGDLMESRALDRGYLTAKGGRPDANRAGNEMMRALADGRVRWGFWPPGSDLSGREGSGIWLDDSSVEDKAEEAGDHSGEEAVSESDDSDNNEEDEDEDDKYEEELRDEEDAQSPVEDGAEEEDGEDETDDDLAGAAKPRGGFFAALDIGGEDEDDEDDEDEDEEGATSSEDGGGESTGTSRSAGKEGAL